MNALSQSSDPAAPANVPQPVAGTDRVESSVRLLVGLIAGFGAPSHDAVVRSRLGLLDPSESRSVLSSLDPYVANQLRVNHPGLLSFLETKVAG